MTIGKAGPMIVKSFGQTCSRFSLRQLWRASVSRRQTYISETEFDFDLSPALQRALLDCSRIMTRGSPRVSQSETIQANVFRRLSGSNLNIISASSNHSRYASTSANKARLTGKSTEKRRTTNEFWSWDMRNVFVTPSLKIFMDFFPSQLYSKRAEVTLSRSVTSENFRTVANRQREKRKIFGFRFSSKLLRVLEQNLKLQCNN